MITSREGWGKEELLRMGLIRPLSVTRGEAGLTAFVASEHYDWLNSFGWCGVLSGRKHSEGFYAHAHLPGGRPGQNMKLHRLVLAAHLAKLQLGRETDCEKILSTLVHAVDHKDGNGLHNWPENLRLLTQQQNTWAFRSPTPGTSQFRGVSWSKRAKKWQATLMKNRRQIYGGVYLSEEEAALAYNRLAVEHFGPVAQLNEVFFAE